MHGQRGAQDTASSAEEATYYLYGSDKNTHGNTTTLRGAQALVVMVVVLMPTMVGLQVWKLFNQLSE